MVDKEEPKEKINKYRYDLDYQVYECGCSRGAFIHTVDCEESVRLRRQAWGLWWVWKQSDKQPDCDAWLQARGAFDTHLEGKAFVVEVDKRVMTWVSVQRKD